MTTVFFLIVGFVLLYYGAEWLVRGSASFAHNIGVRPIVIGLTIVAFATSSPELFVGIVASYQGRGDIMLGNVIGSNIINIGLILGISAVVSPLVCRVRTIKTEVPIMLAVSLALFLLSLDSTINRVEGVFLFLGIVAFIWFSYSSGVREKNLKEDLVPAELKKIVVSEHRMAKEVGLMVGGLLGLVVGAYLLVESAVVIARTIGVSEKFIGLTLLAGGTSLPELATSTVAALRKQPEITVGNIIGSNIFNILSIVGIVAMIKPISMTDGFIQSGFIIDYAIMLLFSFLLLPVMRTGYVISRLEGAVLMALYSSYIVWLSIRG
ncbi:MAG: calcium/sodium antiporter [Bacteroidota bacterium]